MYLSVIIPAYDEAKRIGGTLDLIDSYLTKQDYDYEIIVVDDGSKDKTGEVVKNRQSKIKNLKLLDNQKNHGKGWVVKQGMLEARGEYRLFTDADNSTSIEQIEKFWPYTKQGYDVVIGSIEATGAQINEHAQWYRRMLGHFSKYLIRIVAGLWSIHDTQRGFKLFSAKSAQDIFSKARIDRFGFDVEALALAQKFHYTIKELPVIWNNPGESKVSLKSYIATFVDLTRIRFYLWFNKYK